MSAAKKPKHNESPLLVKEEEQPKHFFERLAEIETGVVQNIFNRILDDRWYLLLLGKTFWRFVMLEVYKDKKPNLVVRVRRPPKIAIFNDGGLLYRFMTRFTIVEIDITEVQLPELWQYNFMDRRINTLKKLALENIHVGHETFSDLIGALYVGSREKFLHLEMNACGLTDKCFTAFVFICFFHRFHNLESLKLAGNSISNNGVANLAPLLAKLPHLKLVDLRNNQITAEGKEVLRTSLAGNRNVEIHL